ncbi:apses-domain-containing protein [Wolfiporia cocos MD-104 SS10]|uniref:Apses-domain-containing protein n=1 Tax=Wolfiporia cocos (strain MD-104) TaxID=742152 RepID=A0A2H3JQA3_WOLCO|nr:apses-domain-containing protein [Wolfiporia cocos MD-104 SS10]
MQAAPRAPAQQTPVKIYNAVYSSVQVYECMVRGIAVMRRRTDSYVNATQILKVAGVDKGRRTKILEKEILPGKHEIVQGGYGKYQGTWIPLERGRDIAIQYGVAPLLAPLFDFVPNANPLGALPAGLPNITATGNFHPGGLAPPPIMPGSALRLLNQGRAQGLFTPSTSGQYALNAPSVTPTPPPSSLKRSRSDLEPETSSAPSPAPSSQTAPPALAPSPDIHMINRSRPPSAPPQMDTSPAKRPRIEQSPMPVDMDNPPAADPEPTPPPLHEPSPSVTANGLSRPASSQSLSQPPFQPQSQPQSLQPQLQVQPQSRSQSQSQPETNGQPAPLDPAVLEIRFASKPYIPRTSDAGAPLRDTRRAAIVAAITKADEPVPIIDQLREIAPDNPALMADVDLVLDDQGHTALHLAASMARHNIVRALLDHGADMHRGNYNGETPLVRACIATHNADQQTAHILVQILHPTIRTLDSSRKSVLHHIVASAGVKGRAVAARYYLDQVFYWIAEHQGGEFRSMVDLQDEHGDTALNIAARVGNKSLVRTLLDVGANRLLPNKLGLRAGDYGVETEELGGPPRADDYMASNRSGPSAPVQKSQEVLTDLTAMIQQLGNDFTTEIKTKQDALDVTQVHLRAATRELSEQRKQIQSWTARCSEVDQIHQRIRNLRKALDDEDRFDWTGRTEGPSTNPAFRMRGPNSTMLNLGSSVELSFTVDTEPAVPPGDSVATLIRLRRMKMWHERVEQLMQARMGALQGASAEKEFQCKKIVALCTGAPIDKIEDMLDNLVLAVESESQVIDIGRASGFMQKVKSGVI